MALTAEQERRHDELRAVKERVEERFLAQKNVSAIGVGFKEKNGERTGELAIRIYVRRKGEFPEAERVPEAIEGYPTDVIEADFREETEAPATATAGPDTKRYNPLVGGISIAPSRVNDIAGTLGIMVTDAKGTNQNMMLSNYHVMCLKDGKQKVGDEMCQEARADNAVGWCGNCSELSRWKAGNVTVMSVPYGIDAAVAKQTARNADVGKVVGIGTVSGTTNPAVDMKVKKRGRTTELTEGTIEDVSATRLQDFGPPIGEVVMSNQIIVKADGEQFSAGGDSGSVYIRTTGTGALEVVGLHIGSDGTKRAVGCWIGAVIAALDITIP